MMSMRSDFLGALQSDAPLFKVRRLIDVPPLAMKALREVVSRPAQLLGARFESEGLIDIISRRAAEDSVKDVGALAAPVLHARRYVDRDAEGRGRRASASGAILRAWRRVGRSGRQVPRRAIQAPRRRLVACSR